MFKPFKVTSFDIELTQRCNLNCPYCYLGQLKSKGTITKETLDLCLAFVEKFGTVKKGKTKVTNVNFYGGEPLLAWEEIVYFVEECKKRQWDLTFTVVSNGIRCDDEIIEYCKKNKLSVQRSLDGSPSAMAICRGEGTLERYNEATKKWKDYDKTRRMTVMPETAKYLVGSLNYFVKLGFKKGFSPMPDYYSEWKPEHIETFKKELWRLADEYIKDFKEKGHGFYCYWIDREKARFDANNRTYCTSLGCGAGRGLHCITWDGYLFLCHRFASEPRDSEFCGGHVSEYLAGTARGFSDMVYTKLQQAWDKKRPEKCKDCIGQVGCNLCCYHSNWKCTGDMMEAPESYCEIKREMSKIYTYMDNQLREVDPNWHGSKKKTQNVQKKSEQKPQQKVQPGNHPKPTWQNPELENLKQELNKQKEQLTRLQEEIKRQNDK